MGERDFIALVDGVHRLVKAPIVLVRDRLNTHVFHAMRELIAEREWLTVFLLPAHSPDLNPVESVWAHVKRSLANLAVVAQRHLDEPKSVKRVVLTGPAQRSGTHNAVPRVQLQRCTDLPRARTSMWSHGRTAHPRPPGRTVRRSNPRRP
ncbi:transposase [Streptomyces shenzhenensis]|uniref:transposase n=1 Tax=Streptomyces shenzhenensis TaxID=943815 RepID=UPI0036C78B6B